MDDVLIMISGRMRQGLQAFMFLDVPERVETFGLLSFSCCLLGSQSVTFPLAVNIAVALLALIAARSRSDAQLLGLCAFVAFTSATDLLQVFHCSAWGAAMLTVNLVLKFGAASNAYRLVGMPILASDNGLGAVEHGCGSSGPPSGPYQAPPLAAADYEALAVEAASKHVGIGDATQYRAI